MKLLRKINHNFLLGSAIMLVAGVVTLYLIITAVFKNEIRESLNDTGFRLITLLEQNDTVFAIHPFIEVSLAKTLMPPVYKDTLIYEPIEGEFEPYLELQIRKKINGKIYCIITRASAVENEEIILTLFWVVTGLMLAVVSMLFFINRRIARLIWKPFYRNVEKIRNFSVTDSKELGLENASIQEFDELNAAISRLAEKGMQDYKSLKQFTENAAHELQTPLSVISSKIETLVNTGHPTETQMKLFSDLNHEVIRLSTLNKSLLLLAKIENGQFYQKTSVDFEVILMGRIESLQELAGLKGLTLTYEIAGSPVILMSRELAEILISNLLSNAIHHTPEGGKIHIVSNKTTIEISNTGLAEIPNSNRLFERFYKIDAASPTAGLGLAIVHSICTHFNIKTGYTFVENMHRFTLQF